VKTRSPLPHRVTSLVAASALVFGLAAGPAHARSTAVSDPLLEATARDTWSSLVAMTDERTGLTADGIAGDLAHDSRSGYTSTTNVGGYLWSTIAARDLGIITPGEASERLAATLGTLETMPRHAASGMFWNWYRPVDGQPVIDTNPDGSSKPPFASSVDNAWLAAALRVVVGAEAPLAARATALYDSMDFSVFYNCSAYDTTVSETRMTTYLGIDKGEVPASSFYGTLRTMSPGCDADWQEHKPHGVSRTYDGITVFEGTYRYRGMSIVPGWGGSMFEALMPDLFVPEASWGPRSWGLNHPLTVRAQKEHGRDEAGYGFWGFSPASDPFGGYAEYGVDELGIKDDGYHSDRERTNVDRDHADCNTGANPAPTFGDGVVTPHASFLALGYDRAGVLDNLGRLRTQFESYGPGGFYDAVAVRSGTVAKRYLSLDQSMIMGAILNAERGYALKGYFVDERFENAIRPLMQAQIFGSSASPEAPAFTAPAAGRPLPTGPVDFEGTGEPGAIVTVGGVAGPVADAGGPTHDSDGASSGPGGAAGRADELCRAVIAANGTWACTAADTSGVEESVALGSRADDGVETRGEPLSLVAVIPTGTPTPTPTATPTATPGPTPTATPEPTPTPTPTPTPSATPTPSVTPVPSPTPSPTITPTPAPTPTPTSTPTATPTPTPTATPTTAPTTPPTGNPTAEPTAEPSPDPTATPSPTAPSPTTPTSPGPDDPTAPASAPSGPGPNGPSTPGLVSPWSGSADPLADPSNVHPATEWPHRGRPFLSLTGPSEIVLAVAATLGGLALTFGLLAARRGRRRHGAADE